MEPEVSFPCSQQLAIGLYPEPDESSPHPHTLIHSTLNFPSAFTTPKWPLPQVFRSKFLYAFPSYAYYMPHPSHHKVKVIPVLSTEHHSMKLYWGVEV
jgi:hypothetical protein